MASWCVHTGFPPEVFKSLNILERNEFIKAANKKSR